MQLVGNITKGLLIALSLNACSVTNNTPAASQVKLGCESFFYDFQTPIRALRYFTEAARLDPGYIPLANASQTLVDGWDTTQSQELLEEWRLANQMVWDMCNE
jgi:hypothetical protein